MEYLLTDSALPYQAIPFDIIKIEDFLPAVERALELSRAAYDDIRNLPQEQWSFESIVEAMEYASEPLSKVMTVFYNLYSSNSTDEMTPLAHQISRLTVEFSSDITFDEKLFVSLQYLHERKSDLNLTIEQQTVLEKSYRSFVRNGALLNEEQKKEFREIDVRLQQLGLLFADNVLKDTKAYYLHITDPADVADLPDGAIEAAKEQAHKRNLEGWVITLDMPLYLPFMKYSTNRKLREELYQASSARGHKGATDNRPLILEIVRLRHRRATLLGYESYAHYVLEHRMAESPEKVDNLHNTVFEAAKPYADKEIEELKEFARKKDGIEELMPWDTAHYSEMLRKEMFNYDDKMLRPYFALESTLQGMFAIANKMYGIKLTRMDNIPTYADRMTVYKVEDTADNRYLGLLYFDLFPRSGKKQGAWCSQLRHQHKKGGEDKRPHAIIVANFTEPSGNKPALLSYQEVRTLFHEFGHALHVLFSECTYTSVSSTSVYWDFVELPSKFMENWMRCKEAINLFARHYKTGELIPDELLDVVLKTVYFHEGLASLRQTSIGTLDMAWHSAKAVEASTVEEFEEEITGKFRLLPKVDSYCFSPVFLHIFQGGYAAGYYSYKWSEVLEADAFEFFLEKGIFDKEAASRFRQNILAKGGTEDPKILYERFRGKKPVINALFRRAGFVEADEEE